MRSCKGTAGEPDVLVMTATPIPRTLSLTLYGDLEVSLIDELPPGRKPVETTIVDPAERLGAYEEVRHELEDGRQAYVICPLVDHPVQPTSTARVPCTATVAIRRSVSQAKLTAPAGRRAGNAVSSRAPCACLSMPK